MAPPGRGCAVRGCHPGQTNIQHDIFTIGAGMVDIAAAMAATDTSTRSAISPTATFDTASNSVRLSTGANVVWGENSAYALNVVWGSTSPCSLSSGNTTTAMSILTRGDR